MSQPACLRIVADVLADALFAIIGYKYRPSGSRFSYDFSLKVNNVLNNTNIYSVGQWHRYALDPGRDWQVVVGVRF